MLIMFRLCQPCWGLCVMIGRDENRSKKNKKYSVGILCSLCGASSIQVTTQKFFCAVPRNELLAHPEVKAKRISAGVFPELCLDVLDLCKNLISGESRIFLSGRKVLTYLYFPTLFTRALSRTTNCIKWRSCILEGTYDTRNHQTTLQHQSQLCNLSAISQHLPEFSSPGFIFFPSASYFSRHSCSFIPVPTTPARPRASTG